MAVNCCKICFAIEPFFPQNVCIGPLWNKYIPLYMDCVIQIIKGPYGTTNVLDKSIWLLKNSYRPLRIVQGSIGTHNRPYICIGVFGDSYRSLWIQMGLLDPDGSYGFREVLVDQNRLYGSLRTCLDPQGRLQGPIRILKDLSGFRAPLDQL